MAEKLKKRIGAFGIFIDAPSFEEEADEHEEFWQMD